MYKQGKYPIVSKKTLAKGIFDIEIYCPHIAKAAKAGQFAQVQAEGFFLRRPISICDINKDKGTIRLVFEVRGHGTDKISELNKGDIVDIIAPLGNGFKVLEKGKKADILVADIVDGYPAVTHVMVDGKLVSKVKYRRQTV